MFHWGLWRIESKTILKLISSQLGLYFVAFRHSWEAGVCMCARARVCVVMGAVT